MGTNNTDVACYLVTKHSAWKGKYKRIFSVGSAGITTYNPNSMEVTNQWYYHDFIGIMPALKSIGQIANEFIITMRKGGKKVDNMRFSSEHRPDIISEALIYRHNFAERIVDNMRCNGQKVHWSDQRVPVILEVTPCSLDQIDSSTGVLLTSYMFKDIEAIHPVSDLPGGLCIQYGGFGRLHIFATDRRDEIFKKIEDNARKYIGINIQAKKVSLTMQDTLEKRVGKYSADEHITSLCEFQVSKISHRHNDPVRRTLCLSETCLLERDPSTYSIVTLRPLSDVFALVRHLENPQMLTIEYVRGGDRKYTSSDRDSLLASLIDGVRASGNLDVHVRMTPTPRGKRLGPLEVPVDEEVESMHLKFLQQLPPGWNFPEAVDRFNANVSYSGLLHAVTGEGLFAENKEKLILGCLGSMVLREGDQNSLTVEELEAQFHALRRLVASKAGFAALTALPGFREKIGLKVVKALQRGDDGVNHAALDMVCALMQPMHEDADLKQEQLNKASLLASPKFQEKLLEAWVMHVCIPVIAAVYIAILESYVFSTRIPTYLTSVNQPPEQHEAKLREAKNPTYQTLRHPGWSQAKRQRYICSGASHETQRTTLAGLPLLDSLQGSFPRHPHTNCTGQSSGRRRTRRSSNEKIIDPSRNTNTMIAKIGQAHQHGLGGQNDALTRDDLVRVSTVTAAQARTPDEGANWWEHEWKAKASPYQAQPPQEERDRQRHRTEGAERKHVLPQPEGGLRKHQDYYWNP
ncbi:unnamed protein product, partial [Meganyctiphanes norvegica]